MNTKKTAPTPELPKEPAVNAVAERDVADVDKQDRLSQKILGFSFLGATVFLLFFMVYFVFAVVTPMTQPSPFFQEITATFHERLKADQGGTAAGTPSANEDKLTIDLAIILEYTSADIRTASVQIAFALVSGMFLCGVGVLLFTAGITGALQLEASHAGSKFNLATAAPGLVCILMGGMIISFGVTKDTQRPMQAQVDRALGFKVQQIDKPAPLATTGENAPSDIDHSKYQPGGTSSAATPGTSPSSGNSASAATTSPRPSP